MLQVGVALVLLTGATLMMRSLSNLQSVDVGYDSERLLTGIYGLTPAEQQSGVDPATFHLDFLSRVRLLPGVVGTTLGEIPMGGPTFRTIVMASEGDPELTPATHTWVRLQPVADGHLGLLGAEFIEGRDIEASDGADAERVIVLNRKAASVLFPNGSPIGQRMQLGWQEFGGDGATVVGVVEHLQFEQGFGSPPEPQAWVSIRQAARLSTGLMVRTQGDPQDLVPAIRSTLAERNSDIALTSVMTMEERAKTVTARPRVGSMLLSIFAAVSLFLVAAGLYGTIAFTVARRTREIGTVDPVTLGGVSLVLFLVAFVAAYLPARRAMHIDPMTALRME